MYSRYDIKDTSKITLQDIQFFCAMGPPGGGRNDVTPRFLRHFNIIGMNPFNDDTMTKIFTVIISTHFRVSLRASILCFWNVFLWIVTKLSAKWKQWSAKNVFANFEFTLLDLQRPPFIDSILLKDSLTCTSIFKAFLLKHITQPLSLLFNLFNVCVYYRVRSLPLTTWPWVTK